jgi:hypothetical protein
MKEILFSNEPGFANLYLNDIHCLQMTLDLLASENAYLEKEYP